MEKKTDTAVNFGSLLSGERPLPHNLDAEKGVLGCMLNDPSLIVNAMSVLKTRDAFFSAAHRYISGAMFEMAKNEEAIDVLTLANALKKGSELVQAGGEIYLLELMNSVPSTANFDKYIDIVQDASVLRRLIRRSSETLQQCLQDEATAGDVLDQLHKEVIDISDNLFREESVALKAELGRAIDTIFRLAEGNKGEKGFSTGYRDLDDKIGGLKRGEMIVLAARPSIGKTTLAMNIAANVALSHTRGASDEKIAVGVFSLEMNTQSLVLRMVSSEAEISLKDVGNMNVTTNDFTNIQKAANVLAETEIHIDDSAQLDVMELRAKSRRMKEKFNVDLIVIDYLQLLRGRGLNSNSSREQEVAQISGAIKAIAKELNIPVIILAQMNRQAEQGGANKEAARPKLSQLRESGSIEQDADIVMILHRDRGRQIEEDQAKIEAEGMVTELIVAKNRNGETGIVELKFMPQFTKFLDNDPVAGFAGDYDNDQF
ncbi:replicative DNA helicase [Lentisphaera profundi]|uniref:Replicative DNA helicase n=1 Tax=Lentisphaera profundi TaxID=1658616 RepID=A0ABY7VUY3_9BACT|nr:replicative DNA helicase [Lentisphaera profundi]WDE98025.1 replicative DNA helicase [Lentisphaera profundi]